MIGSRYADESRRTAHLKIEVSPHYIDAHKAVDIQRYMDRYAAQILYDPEPSGIAVHLCVDVQGWEPARNLSDLLITRSRRRVDHRGISNVEFDLSEIASVYGAAQSFLFGSASGLQFALYRKDLQAQAVDKTHFWESAWSRRTDEDFKPLYNASKPVWRFEFRYHQCH